MKNTEKFWDILSSRTDLVANKFAVTYNDSIKKTETYLKKSDNVLDFACGTGLICNEIASDVASINAIDISQKMIDIAKTKAEKRKIDNIVFEKNDIFNSKYRSNSFDAVLAFNVLHLLEMPEVIIERMNDLLKPNGYFISSTECAGENRTSIINCMVFVFIKLGVLPHMTFFKTAELEKMIKNGGFSIIETESYYNHKQPNHFVVAKKRGDTTIHSG